MKTQISVVAATLLALCGQANAFDFGVPAANTSKAKTDSWACKKCVSSDSIQGSVGLGLGSAISNDDHAANALGYEDGFAASVDADLLHRSESGIRTSVEAKELGSKRGDLAVTAGRAGQWQLGASLDQKYSVDSTSAHSDLLASGDTLVRQSAPVQQQLDKERQQLGFNAKYMGSHWGSYLSMTSESRKGSQRSSISNGGVEAQNIVAPIDSTTQNLTAAVHVSGGAWLAEVGVKGSWFDNDIDSLALEGAAIPSQAGAPDNEAYSVYLKGRYRLGATQVSGRVASGRQTQDQDLVTLTGVPAGVTAADLQVDTLDGQLALVSRLSSKSTLRASMIYNDRDNASTLYEFDQLRFDALSGTVEQTQAVDRTYATYKVASDYRLASGHKLSGGVDYKQTERSAGDREDTDELTAWARYHWSAAARWDMRVKASFGQRDGSRYQAGAATSTESNELMRKYYLADRDRTKLELEISHTPLDTVSLDFSTYYAMDDYTDTDIGLTESEDYGWDLSGHWQALSSVSITAFGGMQWIDNEQLGSDSGSYATWATENHDEFGYAGVSLAYTGLQAQGIQLSVDYQYSYSGSDVDTSGQPFEDDYESDSHSVSVNAGYAISTAATVGLRYQYERYQDSDYAEIPVENYPGQGVTGLTTLGQLSQNYNAHLIMLTLSYRM
ncbi:MtrB/PioB family decaheme-associated outer membrane protein [Ferrimonas sp. SCSIO 43195]|uniref:MtrB/PioB family decaheme-associated outer membrane protein n=1 Tax=Ferrimonas sp. SCSIO 43195 TaxID=2822844 RepID=UPI002074C9C1|nr:MtrB/PioB family decaheme-associated outer membrane protein [Ferrimonas sp. SCSIO 43195]USD39445.1 MtrB/PioB family decaheme-associated outer membrane protein [Ferrimonas sp. SCSIO 43195]